LGDVYKRQALVLIVLIMLCAWRGNETEMMALLVATAVLFAVSEVMAGIRANFVRWAVTVAGIFYISSGFAHLIMLRDIDNRLQLPAGSGWQYTWLTLITVWAADTFAYFGGRFWGKRKLAETISPKKTVEGFLAGIVGGVLAGWLVGWLWGMEGLIPPVVGLIAGTIGPCGDLLESLLKRHAGVKDSGGLFPGHGGVMDRFDSLILVAPFVYYFLQIALQAG
ncbi:MAG: phosphatidate cytidylyltransferase, partial [Negativicutes bacterium]|nr:phosphatidate cytidylyltransferase [Negativicutes bacterium]